MLKEQQRWQRVSRPHPPSAARAILRDAKRGAPLTPLVARARALDDPYHAARTLFVLAAEPGLASEEAAALAAEALAAMERVDQGWRRAELLGELAKRLARWREPAERAPLAEQLVAMVGAVPAGEPRATALGAVAHHLPQSEALLALALANAGHEVESAKPVLRAWAGALEPAAVTARLRELPPSVAARLLGYLHLQLHRVDRLPDPTPLTAALAVAANARALRYLATVAATGEELRAVQTAARRFAPGERVPLLATLGGCADRLGEPRLALALLLEGVEAVEGIADARHADRARRKLAVTLARLGEEELAAELRPVAPAAREQREPAETRSEPATRKDAEATVPQTRSAHTLALWNTYRGGLGAPHLRAAARGAALCHGFGLDLALVGFPADDLAALCAAVTRDSQAAGARSLAGLAAAGRVRLVTPATDGTFAAADSAWCGEAVATTARPDPAKRAALAALAARGRLCLLVGLGPAGLPRRVLRAAPHHLELTGHGVSLETATAMGAVAERLRALAG